MAVVWKYPFRLSERFTLPLPVGAQILKVDVQREQPCLWALVDPDAAEGERTFTIVGTGHDFDRTGMTHIATFLTNEDMYVWHLFQEGFVTATGRVLTDEEIDAFAEEAERGYDIEEFVERRQP